MTPADIFALLKEARDAEMNDEETELAHAQQDDMLHSSDAVADEFIGRADFQRLFKSFDLPLTDTQVRGARRLARLASLARPSHLALLLAPTPPLFDAPPSARCPIAPLAARSPPSLLQLERLFAMTDLDGNGRVRLKEFEGAWELLTKEIIAESLSAFGLSRTQVSLTDQLVDLTPHIYMLQLRVNGSISLRQVVLTVISFVLLLLILFAFMILSLSGWVGETAFSALAQSGLVCTVAKGITALRKRSKAEQGGAELERAIDFVVGEQSAAAEDE